MDIEEFKNKLKGYKRNEIIITKHAEIQAVIREIDLNEVKNNLLNPDKLVYFHTQISAKFNKEKYDCYFAYSKHLYHRYIIVINGKLIIVTIIKVDRDWQKAVEKR